MDNLVRYYVEVIGLRVQWFHSSHKSLRSSTDLIEAKRLITTELPGKDLSLAGYNALLLSELWWKSLIGRKKILIFQSDTLFYCPLPQWPDWLFDFDYIGAEWPLRRPVGLEIPSGCGGLSMRDWAASVSVLRRFDSYLWVGGEDGFYGFHIDLHGGHVASALESEMFASQKRFNPASQGIHKYEQVTPRDLRAMLRIYPAVRPVFEANPALANLL